MGGAPPSFSTRPDSLAEVDEISLGFEVVSTGAVGSMTSLMGFIPTPARFVAVRLRSKMPTSVGLPTTSPFNGSTDNPTGRELAPYEVGDWVASIWN